MTATILQHSDQIVATLAKLPMSYFGSYSSLRVASRLAGSLMKDQDWSIAMRVKTLAGKAECVPRTVQRAMKRMTANGLFEVEHRKHPTIENFNYASVYKLGPVLRSLCEQAVRRGRQACQGISLKSLFKNKATKKSSRPTVSFENSRKQSKPAKAPAAHFDTQRAGMTPELWEQRKQEGIEHNKRTLARMASMLGATA